MLIIGLGIAGLGLIMIYAGKLPWIGRLPGDFFYRGRHVTFYFPLATSLIISIALTLLLWFIGRK